MKHFFVSLMLVILMHSAFGQIHKCVLADGKTTYQAGPCDGANDSILAQPQTRQGSVQVHSFQTPSESPSFGKPVRANTNDDNKFFSLSPEPPPRELAVGAEIIVVSGYEPSSGSRTGGETHVIIDRPKSRVVLVLSSYEKIAWHVEASPGTQINAVLVSAHKKSTLTTSLKTTGFEINMPYAYETDNVNFRSLLGRLNSLFDIRKIDAFRGKYSLPEQVTISALDPARPEMTLEGRAAQSPKSNFQFDLLTSSRTRAQWSLTGPADKTTQSTYIGDGKLTLSPDGKTAYQLKGDELLLTTIADKQDIVATLPSNFPRFSWAMDLAYDMKRNIVTVATLGGEGFLYRFDAKSKKWLDYRSLNNVDIFSLSYDKGVDRYVAWTSDGELLVISGEGEPISKYKVADRLPGFGEIYDRNNSRAPHLTLATQSGHVALVNITGGTVSRIWHYDLGAGAGELTYKAPIQR